MDKSLDEYAKENKINSRARGGGANRRGGARRGAGANSGNQPGNRFNRSFNARRSGGGIQKRRSAGGAASLSPSKAAAASINGQWSHDLYQNGNALNSNRFRRATSAGALGTGPGPAKLVISNLDFGVNDSDIQGLFQEFGKIRKAAVHYDRSGRSLGTADVLFERKQDAIRALTHYNGVSLDGRPMNIQLTASLSALGNGGNGARRSLGNGGGIRRGGRGGNRGNRGGRAAGQKKLVKSAADLDAELDAHNAKMQTD